MAGNKVFIGEILEDAVTKINDLLVGIQQQSANIMQLTEAVNNINIGIGASADAVNIAGADDITLEIFGSPVSVTNGLGITANTGKYIKKFQSYANGSIRVKANVTSNYDAAKYPYLKFIVTHTDGTTTEYNIDSNTSTGTREIITDIPVVYGDVVGLYCINTNGTTRTINYLGLGWQLHNIVQNDQSVIEISV